MYQFLGIFIIIYHFECVKFVFNYEIAVNVKHLVGFYTFACFVQFYHEFYKHSLRLQWPSEN